MTFGTDIEDAKKMNANEFGGPLTLSRPTSSIQ